ncbi:MAG: hypothetical protein V1893_00880 [Candidatus Omnitrophota bacterium]
MKKVIKIGVAIFLLFGAFILLAKPVYRATAASNIDLEDSSILKVFVRPKPDAIKQGIRLLKEVKYVVGKDNKWFTDDDAIYHYFVYEYDDNGGTTKKMTYTIGPDGIGFTSDDELQEYQAYEYDTIGKLIKEVSYAGKGADNIWFTPDDKEAYYYMYEYSILGSEVKATRYTADNKLERFTAFEHNLSGQLIRDIEYKHKGPDNICFTSDDELEKYHRFEYGEQGRLTRTMEYNEASKGMGSDGKWFTDDDNIFATKVCSYTKDGLLEITRKYIGKGQDNKWFTDDDILQYYIKYVYIEVPK